MKRTSKLACMAVLCLTLILAGCTSGGGNETPQPSGGAESPEGNLLTEPGTFPIVNQPVTLRVLVLGDPNIESIEDNEFTRWYEEYTGVKVEWEVAPHTNAQEKLSLVLSGGNLPDVIMGMNVTPAQQMVYGQEGVFLELSDLIEQYGAEVKKMFADNPLIQDMATAADGNIYALPYVSDCYHCSVTQKMWIYQPWLDKLGLEVPTTTEEFYEVLKAFKELDPNGNNLNDEIPFAGANQNPANHIDKFVMNAFIYNNTTHDNFGLLLEDGKIDVAYNKPEYKEGLTFLHRLYSEGLIAPESFTMDQSQLRQLGENPGEPLLGVVAAFHMGQFTQFYGESGRWLDYTAMPPLEGPGGLKVASNTPYTAVSGRYIITNAAEHPEVAMRWADAFFTQEVLLRGKYGREDMEWKYAEQGQLGIDGEQALFELLQPMSGPQRVHWYNSFPMNETHEFRMGWVAEDQNTVEPILYRETQKYEPYKLPEDQVLPPLYFTTEQSNEIANLQTTVNEFVNEMTARFITGDADIEAEWDSYINRLNSIGLERFIEIYQEAYDMKYA